MQEARQGPTLSRIRPVPRISRRLVRTITLTAVGVALAAMTGCGGDGAGALETLPPIRTTTTVATTTVPVDDRIRLYTVKAGDNLSRIAAAFEVPRQFLIDANSDKFDDPNNLQPGVVLEIPPYVVIEELPTPSTSEP